MATSTRPAGPSPERARAALADYLSLRQRERERAFAPRSDEAAAKRLVKRLFPRPFRMGPRIAATALLRHRERRRFALHSQPLRLHLGSGYEHKDRWLNVDLAGYPVEAAWNLARPLPLEDASVAAIFHEHLLEHLTLEEGLALCRECHRLLRPGGVLRIGVPDAGAAARSYLDDADGFLEHVRPGRPTPLLALQELFYYPGHRTMYDSDTLVLVLRAAGFEQPQQKTFGETLLDPIPDSPHRRAETLYVEAIR